MSRRFDPSHLDLDRAEAKTADFPTMMTRAEARRQEAARVERALYANSAFAAVPNDVLVSIFASALAEPAEPADFASWSEYYDFLRSSKQNRSSALRWARETFPLVCKQWRDLYRSQQASPLHETLEIDLTVERRLPTRRPPPIVRAATAIARWARRHAGDVQRLSLIDRGTHYCNADPDVSSRDLATLLKILARRNLREIEIDLESTLLVNINARFWDAMRDFVAPAGMLRKLRVEHISRYQGDFAFLSQLTCLEELVLQNGDFPFPFPESVLALTDLRRVDLSYNWGITSVPPGISSLQQLESLSLHGCSLSSLPEELGSLKRLTRLEVAGGVAFSAATCGSLRHLKVTPSRSHTVPSVVGEIKTLEFLDLRFNENLGKNAQPPNYGFPESFPELPALTRLDLSQCYLSSVPPAVLSSMPRLRILDLSCNRLMSLPETLGQRLRELRRIDLDGNCFGAFPCAALAGATSLEKVCFRIDLVSVGEPLDFLFENFPKLRDVRLIKFDWTKEVSQAVQEKVERFAARLRERNRAAAVKVEDSVTYM